MTTTRPGNTYLPGYQQSDTLSRLRNIGLAGLREQHLSHGKSSKPDRVDISIQYNAMGTRENRRSTM